jgi:hypothetical protein
MRVLENPWSAGREPTRQSRARIPGLNQRNSKKSVPAGIGFLFFKKGIEEEVGCRAAEGGVARSKLFKEHCLAEAWR